MVTAYKPFKLRALFAAHVRTERKLKGLSQEALAEKCGLHRTYIGSIERGERNLSIDNVERLAKALDVDPSILVAGSTK
jgi:transcriptional regulator with XRE-family HTH domain